MSFKENALSFIPRLNRFESFQVMKSSVVEFSPIPRHKFCYWRLAADMHALDFTTLSRRSKVLNFISFVAKSSLSANCLMRVLRAQSNLIVTLE